MDLTTSDAGLPAVEHVRQLEALLLTLPQVDLSTEHFVFGGMSVRTIFIPAGTVLTGALTRCDNVCVVHGDITVTTDTGPKRLVGFNVIPALAGAKRAGVTNADTWWTTIHRTEARTAAEAEEEMTDEADMLQTRTLRLEAKQ